MKVPTRPKIFFYRDYKDLLRNWLEYLGHSTPGAKTRLARALRVPSPFISQVLHGAVNFTPDHAFLCAEHWKLNLEEQNYFLDLVNLARASTPELKKHLEGKLKSISNQQRELAPRLHDPAFQGAEAQWIFYTHWRLSPVSLLLTIPEYQNVKKIADRLHVSEEEIKSDLKILESLGIIKAKRNGYEVTGARLHLDRGSPVSPIHHLIWRQKAISSVMNPKKNDYHYSGVHTLSRADVEKIQEVLVEAIQNTRKIIDPSPEEELICIACDLFQI